MAFSQGCIHTLHFHILLSEDARLLQHSKKFSALNKLTCCKHSQLAPPN